MGTLVNDHPKCMTRISSNETILSRQLKQIADCGIEEVIMTTGPFHDLLTDYCGSLGLPLDITFVNNPKYAGYKLHLLNILRKRPLKR